MARLGGVVRLATIALALAPAFWASQTPGTASIAGSTVDQATGRPLSGVAVHLRLGALSYQTTSKSNGRFEFRGLPPGSWFLTLRFDGWTEAIPAGANADRYEDFFELPVSEGQLESGQHVDGLRLGLWKYAALSGRVVDSSGAPVAGATVSALGYRAVAGRMTIVSGPDAQTDYRGVYQFPTLEAGDYVLTASVAYKRLSEISSAARNSLFVFTRDFYPRVSGAAAPRTVAIKWGQTLTSMDFVLQKREAFRVSGRVTGASSFRDKAYVRLEWTDPLERADHLFAAYGYLDAAGTFSVGPVPPGRYVLTTHGATSLTGRMLWTRQPIVVGNANLEGVTVPVRLGLRLIGRVQFEGTLSKPSAEERVRIAIALTAPDARGGGDVMPPHTNPKPNGSFTSAEAPAGRYVISVWGQPKGWFLRSAMVSGKDAADSPIELMNDTRGAVITFTDRPTRMRGRVLDAKGAPAPLSHVLVFPATESLWTDFGHARRLRATAADKDGNYELAALPSGDYLAVAVAAVPGTGWRDAAFLRNLAASATRVSLAEGRGVSQQLRLSSAASR